MKIRTAIIITSFVLISLSIYVLANGPLKAPFTQAFFKNSTQRVLSASIDPNTQSDIPASHDYITVVVGDSIINTLGSNAEPLRQKLLQYYPTHEFVTYNYGYGASNILSLPERMNQRTTYEGKEFAPILDIEFDLIIIDSFAYNPLSQFPLTEGLQKQTEIFDQAISDIRKRRPQAVIALMAPYAPVKDKFATGVYDLTPEQRRQWAEERIAYIENTIAYAESKQVPLINVYEKTRTDTGDGDPEYFASDFIHPSEAGVDLMAETIADFIYDNQIFPESSK